MSPTTPLLYLMLLLFIPSIQGAKLCPKGYYSWRKQLCLRVSKQFATYQNAQAVCLKEGGTLASVHSASEMNFIRILMLSGRAKDAYLGIAREANREQFTNSDDTELDFVNWRTPNQVVSPRMECAFVSSRNNFKWLLNLCNAALRYVCKIVPESSQLPTKRRHRCYVCDGALSNEECNRNGMQECQINQLSCQNEVRIQQGVKRISKRCKQPQACENNYIQNPRAAWYPSQCSPTFRANSVCRCCCQGDLCNASELPCLEDSSCEALTVPQNALISCTNEYRPGSQCTFRCEEGYGLVGGASRSCNGVSRNWTGSSPTCKKITCPVQRIILNNGEMNCTDENNYASTCMFKCNENYTLRGRRAMTCLRGGRWSALKPVCQMIRCPGITSLLNGLVNGSASPVIGSFRSFQCEEGYFLRGADTLYCIDRNSDGNGEWDNTAPECELIVCPEAIAPSNGSMLLSSEPVYDSVLSYSCDEGHFLVGNAVSRCTDINNDGVGEWDYPVPRCREILCPDIEAPNDGRFTNQKQRQYGAEVNVACDEGYYLVGDRTVTCHDQDKDGLGEWDRSLPLCEVLMCPILETPSNGNVELPSRLIWGSSASFDCEVGYFLRGSQVLRCITSNTYGLGEWDELQPTCELIQCPGLAPPTNGSFTDNLKTFYDSTVKIVCDEGFFLVGESTLTCGDTNNDGSGEWSDELPQCPQIVCLDQPNAPLNGYILSSLSKSVYGSIAILACDEGYFMIGSSETECGDSDEDGNGDWLGTTPICQRITCPVLTTPPNGIFTASDSFNYDSVVVVDCDEGYFLNGRRGLQCEDSNGDGNGNWNGTIARCDRIMCPVVEPPTNGKTNEALNLEYGSELSFTCDEGFFLTGNQSVLCQDSNSDGDGDWSNAAPTCEQITCSPPGAPTNGKVNSLINTYGSEALFSCNDGHFLIGSQKLTCVDGNNDGQGEWGRIEPTCRQIVCETVEAPSHGFFVSELDLRWGSVVRIACEQGYYLNGVESITCVDEGNDGNGEWNGIVPTCQLITCPSVRSAVNGVFQISDETLRLGTEITIKCNEGYYDFDGIVPVCSGDNSSSVGEWGGGFAQCDQIQCQIPEDLVNGDVILNSPPVWGSSASFTCDVGYVLSGDEVLTCVDDDADGIGNWNAPSPACERIQCTVLQPPVNGNFVVAFDAFYNSTVEIVCDEGYFLVGKSKLTCGDLNNDGSGDWSDELPQCPQIICRDSPNAPANGFLLSSPASPVYGSVAMLACDEGYFMIGSSETECGDSDNDGRGEWITPLPICHRIKCSDLTAPPNGQLVSVESFEFGATVTLQCEQGYFVVGQATLLCQDADSDGNGEWNGTIATCKHITCPSLSLPTNGNFVSSEDFFWGSTLTYTCDEGYLLVGNPTVLCNDFNNDGEGDWSNEAPICQEIMCQPLEVLRNGNGFTPTNNYGSQATFSCNDGYFLIGTESFTCVDSDNDGLGEWSDSPPTCAETLCEPIEAPDNGYFASSSDFRWGSLVKFACEEGYYLNGVKSITCVDEGNDGNGEWTGVVPTCQLIVCPSVNNAVNGFFQISDETLKLGTEITIQCNEGYYDFDAKVSICSGDNSSSVGEWRGDFPECDPIVCQDGLPSPEGGEVFCTEDSFYGSLCLFSCFVGYHLRGSSAVECIDSDSNGLGEWTDPAPICERILCLPKLESPQNGSVSCSSLNLFDSDCHFTCDVGYFLSGQDLIRCLDDDQDGIGTWSAPSPVCNKVTCDQRNSPEHGNVSCSDGPTYGSQCTFTCDVGFSLVGFDSVQCGEPVLGPTGRWDSETEPNCQINICEKASANPTNGTVQCSSGNEYNSVCEYTCVQGYRMVGSSSRRCLANREWSDSEPKCEIIRCKPAPTNPDDGLVFCSAEDKFGSVCSYFCDLGFQLVGESRSECYEDTDNDGFGEFDTQPGYCEAIRCPDIEGMRQDGTVICGIGSGNDDGNSYGSECALICFDGFKAQGPSRAICLGKGQWTENLGVCERYKCFPPLFTPDGVTKTCSNSDDELGTVCRFQCSPGFTLQGSQEVTCLDSGEWSNTAPSCGR